MHRSPLVPLLCLALGLATVTAVTACGGGNIETKVNTAPAISKTDERTPTLVTGDETARQKFEGSLAAFLAHDRAADWNDTTCTEVAQMFDDAASARGSFPEATFDAGIAYQRCKNDAAAKDHFRRALAGDPHFHYAKVQLTLYQFKADANIDAAIGRLQEAVLDAQYQNVPALVNLALLQMQRDGSTASNDCNDDMECAKKNLQRALAIDDAYMPALNQLALYYFDQAKKRVGAIRGREGRSITTSASIAKRADVQQLELAALVASQAMQKNPGYAPIYNTAGLVQNELGKINLAVQLFSKAAALDPTFFEAQMNYGEVNLSFRGFVPAEGAFRKALKIRKNDYDAHLGLALALRGQITGGNYNEQVAAVQAELDACKQIEPSRPDAYYNEGILTQEYKAALGTGSSGIAETTAALERAIIILTDFSSKAADKLEYVGAVNKAKDRIQDANDILAFLRLGSANGIGSLSPTPSGNQKNGSSPTRSGNQKNGTTTNHTQTNDTNSSEDR